MPGMLELLRTVNNHFRLTQCSTLSELSDTRKAVPSLLSSNVSKLSPDIIAVYINSAAKVFGAWAVDLAARWDDDDLQEVKEVVASVISAVRQFTSSADFEVQERVGEVLVYMR